MKDFFISYTRADQAWAEWIAWTLRELGYTVEIQAWHSRPGMNFVAWMDEALRTTCKTVLVISRHFPESEYAKKEWTSSIDRLLPIRVDDHEPQGLLSKIVYVDLHGLDESSARNALRDGLRDPGAPEHPPQWPGPEKPREAPLFPGAAESFEAYSKWAGERHRGLNLIGVGGGDVKLRLEEVYVPLRISQRRLADLDQRIGKRRGELALEHGARDVELEEIFREPAAGPHVAIFGDPGAGKTTVLRKLHHQCLSAGGPSLGLDGATLPVFLRLRRLQEEDLDVSPAAFIERELHELSGGELADDLGWKLWQRGRLLLLLDGLDEVADDALRARICRYLEWSLDDAVERGVRAVVSCRYAGYGGEVDLGESFLSLDVRPLDAAQCRELVRLWFREVPSALPRFSKRQAREAAERLAAALDGADYGTQRLKVLVGSPLLLTLLCVVVLRGGEMPKQRVAFYDQCLRVLLSQWGRSKPAEEEIREPPLDVEAALAVLRSLAWELHRRERRDDLHLMELVFHVRERLEELGKSASAFEVVRWLHRETGVLEEFAPRHYGLMHLGLQEYLAALHAASRGDELLGEICDHFDDEWWQEVVLLLVGLPGRRLFGPLMERVLATPLLLGRADLIRKCLDEAPEVDLDPFLALLELGVESERQAAALRLLRGRTDPRLLERVAPLAESGHRDVAALASQIAGDLRRQATPEDLYDVFVLHHPADASQAAELAATLRRRGLRAFAAAEDADWMGRSEAILEGARCVAVPVGASGHAPWEKTDLEFFLRLFARSRRPLVPVRLPGSETVPAAPSELALGPWADFRKGPVLEVFEKGIALPVTTTEASARIVPGEPFTEPVTGETLLWIPGGRFRMGGDAFRAERPIHWVRVSPFWLAETPVTNRRYALFLEKTKHEEPALWRDRRFSAPEQPVVGVSWHDAQAYCQWLSDESRLAVQLPTEAQWEFTARCTESREYPWGDEKPDHSRACFGLDFREGQPAEVGSFPAGRGPFGTLDQAGNVWEWCRDAWDDKAYAKRAKGDEVVDPFVEEGEEEWKGLRGGAWVIPAESLRAAYRRRFWADGRVVFVGFRVAVSPPST